ncbi:hypothetical protein [Actinomadura sp. WMMA1423]|uniref:hypothetical protein n=1 Tax=Actinomadura sp. WMMA1423 TaxID=2591108 RepID=UPI001147949C|nr:hypothetical protein [Actinomadura sp. WMMA1423]
MSITDEQVAVLRAQLTRKREEHLRLMDELDPTEANEFYPALVAAAFIEAAEYRFIKNGEVANEGQVVDFVAQMRERSDESSDLINPRLAESMILDLLGKGTMLDAEPGVKFGHQIVMVAAMVGEREFTPAELEAFLQSARSLAEELLK